MVQRRRSGYRTTRGGQLSTPERRSLTVIHNTQHMSSSVPRLHAVSVWGEIVEVGPFIHPPTKEIFSLQQAATVTGSSG